MMLGGILPAFLVGGLICVLAQLFIELTPYKVTPSHILVAYVVSGTFISALGWYQPLVDFAGAGATLPLSGFGHILAQGVIEAVEEEGLQGVFTGGISAASMGITIALMMGVLMSLIFKPKG